jgi:hypothetical protein
VLHPHAPPLSSSARASMKPQHPKACHSHDSKTLTSAKRERSNFKI